MAGPYRTRLVRPESFDAFWRGVEQRARLVRRLPRAVLALAFVPALAVPITTGWGQAARPHALARSVVSPMDEPFGLIVSRTSVRERRGALPPGVPRPDLEPGTVTIGALQRLTAGQVRRPLEACYERALSEQPSLGGDLVVSVAVGTEGEPHAIVSGPRPLREAMGDCATKLLVDVRYPRPKHEALWFHYPLRFEPAG